MFQFQNNNNNAIVLELFINYLDDIIDEILLPLISFEANEESIESLELCNTITQMTAHLLKDRLDNTEDTLQKHFELHQHYLFQYS